MLLHPSFSALRPVIGKQRLLFFSPPFLSMCQIACVSLAWVAVKCLIFEAVVRVADLEFCRRCSMDFSLVMRTGFPITSGILLNILQPFIK